MSEFTGLRARIEEKIEAMKRMMNVFAVVVSHGTITHHYERPNVRLEQSTAQVGEQAAMETLIAELEAPL